MDTLLRMKASHSVINLFVIVLPLGNSTDKTSTQKKKLNTAAKYKESKTQTYKINCELSTTPAMFTYKRKTELKAIIIDP